MNSAVVDPAAAMKHRLQPSAAPLVLRKLASLLYHWGQLGPALLNEVEVLDSFCSLVNSVRVPNTLSKCSTRHDQCTSYVATCFITRRETD